MSLAAHGRFKAWFESLGITQAALAERLKCDQSVVSFLLAGRRRAGIKVAAAIARESADWSDGPIEVDEWLGLEADSPESADSVPPAA